VHSNWIETAKQSFHLSFCRSEALKGGCNVSDRFAYFWTQRSEIARKPRAWQKPDSFDRHPLMQIAFPYKNCHCAFTAQTLFRCDQTLTTNGSIGKYSVKSEECSCLNIILINHHGAKSQASRGKREPVNMRAGA